MPLCRRKDCRLYAACPVTGARFSFAAVFLASFLNTVWFALALSGLPATLFAQAKAPAATSSIEQRFAQLRKNPPELYAFLLRMPKGGDLHNHLAGAVYAESFIRAAAEDNLCVDQRTLAIVPRPTVNGSRCGDGRVEATAVQSGNALRDALINSLSMRNFVPGSESAHDHFFAAFGKFGAVRGEHNGEFVAEVATRAAGQNESYLELMALSGGGAASALGARIGFDGDFERTREQLLANGLERSVKDLQDSVDAMDQGRRAALGCEAHPDSAPCHVTVHYIYQVLREFPKEQVFAQVLAGFMLADMEPRVVAVNFVQPEDGVVSMRDYHLQMRMVDYAHRLYPKVHIALHAGELASGLVPPDGLRFHIREAVELGHAERIGHGVDLPYETDAIGLLRLMKQRRVAVEINLTSNDVILGVRGDQHPFPMYRKYGVPVTLSTDDEGVSRGHLTEEYVRATLTYGLSYADLKQIVRNGLEYSFAPGESYWKDATYRIPAGACAAGREAKSCQSFLQENEKARLEAELEDRFREFEKSL